MSNVKKLLGLILFLVIVGVPAKLGPTLASPKQFDLSQISPSEYAHDEVLVKYKGETRFTRVRVAQGESVASTIEKFNQRKDVQYTEPNFKAFALETPSDSLYDILNRPETGYEEYTDTKYSEQWALNNEGKTGGSSGADISWEEAYAVLKDLSLDQTVVAIVDSGLDVNHPDLDQKIFATYSVLDGSLNVPDDYGHGTHVAGTAAAETNNLEGTQHEGVASVGFVDSVKLFPIKVLDENGVGTDADVAEGIYHAADNGAQVINLSVGSFWDSTPVREAVEYAWGEKGVLLVASAGNSGNKRKVYPAYYEKTISVAATDKNDGRYTNGTHNNGVDVSAPGVEVLSTFPTHEFKIQSLYGRMNNYDVGSGTSMASPHVAGLAALLFAKHPSWTNSDVRTVIEATSDDLGKAGWDEYFGHGRINVYKAVTTDEVPTPTPTPTPKPKKGGGPPPGKGKNK